MSKGTKTPLKLARTPHEIECGIDEVARGCLLGRVYAGAVVFALPQRDAKVGDPLPELPLLPKGVVIRDSKTMSRAQRERAAAWIHENAFAACVEYKDEAYIETRNILHAAQDAMGDAVRSVQELVAKKTSENDQGPLSIDRLLVDGHTFNPSPFIDTPAVCVVKGDATYFAIACAAIIAKVAHDQYIQELCDAHPKLHEWYDLRKNVGYGTAKHCKGLTVHGTTPFHRKTFGKCKDASSAIGWDQ
jgi:ribonuclease HII